MSKTQFTLMPIERLVFSGRNPRQEMRNLEELAENIKEYGILEPIIARPKEDKFEVVIGERRVRASILAGHKEIPALISAVTDRQADELRLIENIHREDLTDVEKGDAVYALLENYPDKYPAIISVAEKLGKPYDSIRVWTRKTRKLSDFVKRAGFESRLSEDAQRRLLKYDHDVQDKLAKVIILQDFTERETIKFLKLYDENPEGDLETFAKEAKDVKGEVKISIEELPKEVREYVEPIMEEKRKTIEKMREESRRKAVEESAKTRKEWVDRRRKAKERKKETPKQLIYTSEGELAILKNTEIPKEVIREKTEALIEKLNEIEHPLQRERMIKEIPRAMESLVRRVDKAPEKRELVEHKLDRLRELEEEGVFLSTLWDIGERADYAGTRDFHGNCPPQVVEQCVLRLTKKGDLVVDPMAGSGTALDVCELLDRKCIGYDIKPPVWRSDIIQNDSQKIPLENTSADMVFLHPPYWDMVYYTEANEKLPDLSRTESLEQYLRMLEQVLQECYRVLKEGKYLCILLGDRIKDGKFIPLCRKVANLAEEVGFIDCGYAIKFTQGATSLMVKGKMIYAELAYTENLKAEHDLVMFFKKGEIENAQ